jgi:hypothetical protein
LSDNYRLRTVVRSERFENEWGKLGLEPELSDDVLAAVEWALARDPIAAGTPVRSERGMGDSRGPTVRTRAGNGVLRVR